MRRIAIAAITSLFVLPVFFASPASAADAVDNAISSLKSSTVYVEPGTENTDRDTVVDLKSSLSANDRILLVMLPGSVAEETSIDQVMERIDNATGHKFIIGLAVGREAAGYSRIMPDSVASDLMDRAKSISVTSVDSLTTFVKVIHEWQKEHPEATSESSGPTGTSSSGAGGFIVLLIVMIITTIIAISALKTREKDSNPKPSFEDAPKNVRDELIRLHELKEQIEKTELKSYIEQIVSDTVSFFQRSAGSDSHDTKYDAEIYERNLQTAIKVAELYVDAQNNPRFYDESLGTMTRCQASLVRFSEYVVTTIREDAANYLDNYGDESALLSVQRSR